MDGQNLKLMRETRGNLYTQMKEVVETAAAEKRGMLPEEQEKFDKLEMDEASLAKTIASIDKVSQLGTEIQNVRTELQHAYDHDAKKRDKPTTADYQRSFAAWAMGSYANKDQLRSAEKCRINPADSSWAFKLVRNPPETMEQAKQWLSASRGQVSEEWITRETTLSLQVGTSTIAKDIAFINPLQALEATMKWFGGVREVANVMRTDNGQTLNWPVVDDTSAVSVIINESTDIDVAASTYKNKAIDTYMYTSKYVKASIQTLQDSAFDIASFVTQAIGERMGRGTNTHFTKGTGTAQPFGVATEASVGVQQGALKGTSIETTNLIALEHSVDRAWRTGPGVAFMMHDHVLKLIKALTDTQGRLIWVPGLASSVPNTILGHSYVINNDMATDTTVATQAATETVLFGNFKKFIVRDVREVMLFRANELFMKTGDIGWVALSRHGSRTISASTANWPINALVSNA